jgi:hypothetical protein
MTQLLSLSKRKHIIKHKGSHLPKTCTAIPVSPKNIIKIVLITTIY